MSVLVNGYKRELYLDIFKNNVCEMIDGTFVRSTLGVHIVILLGSKVNKRNSPYQCGLKLVITQDN